MLLSLLVFSTMTYSSMKINLEDYIKSFLWSKRIILLITKEENISFIKETDDFLQRNSCENEARNLEYIRIIGDDVNKYMFPDRYKNKDGLWLIGYDGQDKSFSNDTSLLREIHNIIDAMPVRKMEMAKQNERCD